MVVSQNELTEIFDRNLYVEILILLVQMSLNEEGYLNNNLVTCLAQYNFFLIGMPN